MVIICNKEQYKVFIIRTLTVDIPYKFKHIPSDERLELTGDKLLKLIFKEKRKIQRKYKKFYIDIDEDIADIDENMDKHYLAISLNGTKFKGEVCVDYRVGFYIEKKH